jgi:hypothetical protein
MYSSKNRRILFTTIFAAVVSLSAAMLVTTTGRTLMLTPAFAQASDDFRRPCPDIYGLNENGSTGSGITQGENMSGGVIRCSGPHGIPTTIIP